MPERAAPEDILAGRDLPLDIDNLHVQVLWFRTMPLERGFAIARHTHSSFEFHFVADGGCRVTLDDRGFIARAGQFYLTGPGVFHSQSSLEDVDYLEYSFTCDITLRDQRDSEGARLLQVLADAPCSPVGDRYGAAFYFERALAEARQAAFGHYAAVGSLAELVLLSAARALAGDIRPSDPPPARKDHRFEQIHQFILDNLSRPVRLQDLRQHVYLSEKQIGRIVQAKTGRSTKAYVSSLRLQAAKDYLRDTDLSLREIAERLGFTSEYYFNQFFKREEGYPPGVYRKNVR